jgi:hypothetical protein
MVEKELNHCYSEIEKPQHFLKGPLVALTRCSRLLFKGYKKRTNRESARKPNFSSMSPQVMLCRFALFALFTKLPLKL